MIPSFIDPNDSPPGEVELFGLLKHECDDDWIVLHSLDLPQHVRQIEGELDFLILVPGGGAICLEIKSHERVQRDQAGLWHLGSAAPDRRGPFRQASEGMRSTKNRLKGSPGLASVPFISAVAFPRCNFDVPATEWEPWQVFDESTLRTNGIQECILRVARGARKKFNNSETCTWFRDERCEPTVEQCEQIRDALRPVFERQRSPKERRAESQSELRQYTEEQFKALDRLDTNPRIVFTGAAGTGKTFLALEAARRAAGDSQRVLLCCFNRLLGEWLSHETEPIGSNVWAGTLHRLMFEIAGADLEGNPGDPGYWSEELPSLTIDRLLRGHPYANSFDLVLIDEAQDLCTGPYLDVIDLLLSGGIHDGNIRAFGDFDRQLIYTDSDGRDLLNSRTRDLVRYGLSENCRNRPRIGHLAGVVSGPGNPYIEFRRKDDGVNVGIAQFNDEEEQITALSRAIDLLRGENLQLGDIVILSPFKTGSAASLLPEPYRGWLSPADNSRPGKIRFSSIHAFKGLESPAVIVSDIRRVDRLGDKQLLYVAASRATDRLYLLVDSAVATGLAELVIGGGV